MSIKHNYKDILHNVNLTEGQISVILYSLDVYAEKNYSAHNQKDIDAIYQELEGTVDRFYDKMEKAQSKQPVAEWTD